MTNRHHILYTRKLWKPNWSYKLRNNPYFIIPIDTRLHKKIHEQVQYIPIPRGISCRKAVEEIDRLEKFGALKDSDTLSQRLNLLIFIFDYIEPDTTRALKKQLQVVTNWENHH